MAFDGMPDAFDPGAAKPTLPFPLLFARAVRPDQLVAGRPFDITEELAKVRPIRPTGRRDKVLIIAAGHDVHADAVAIELVSAGTPVCRLNVEALPVAGSLSIQLGGPGDRSARGSLCLPCGVLDLDEVKSVWFRRRIFEVFGLGPPSDDIAAFVEREAHAAFAALAGLLHHAFWVSSPQALYAADSKLDQLRMADSIGLAVPRTLITNDPERARDFVGSCQQGAVVKAFRGQIGASLETTRLIYTTRMEPAALDRLELVSNVPCLFQERVDKVADIRVTVIGRRVFAAEITGGSSATDEVDCRAVAAGSSGYRPVTLAPELEAQCHALLVHWGLEFGAIDLLRDRDGRHVFLELNTKAEWQWIEGQTGQPMTRAMADLLGGPS